MRTNTKMLLKQMFVLSMCTLVCFSAIVNLGPEDPPVDPVDPSVDLVDPTDPSNTADNPPPQENPPLIEDPNPSENTETPNDNVIVQDNTNSNTDPIDQPPQQNTDNTNNNEDPQNSQQPQPLIDQPQSNSNNQQQGQDNLQGDPQNPGVVQLSETGDIQRAATEDTTNNKLLIEIGGATDSKDIKIDGIALPVKIPGMPFNLTLDIPWLPAILPLFGIGNSNPTPQPPVNNRPIFPTPFPTPTPKPPANNTKPIFPTPFPTPKPPTNSTKPIFPTPFPTPNPTPTPTPKPPNNTVPTKISFGNYSIYFDYLTFTATNTGTFSLTGCNQHLFKIQLSGTAIKLTHTSSTKRGCPTDYDKYFIQAFKQATNITFTKTGFNLINANKTTLAYFNNKNNTANKILGVYNVTLKPIRLTINSSTVLSLVGCKRHQSNYQTLANLGIKIGQFKTVGEPCSNDYDGFALNCLGFANTYSLSSLGSITFKANTAKLCFAQKIQPAP